LHIAFGSSHFEPIEILDNSRLVVVPTETAQNVFIDLDLQYEHNNFKESIEEQMLTQWNPKQKNKHNTDTIYNNKK